MKAKVCWADVCKPKNEGGLGVIDLVLWNKSAQLKHVWNLCMDYGDSLWPSWVKSEILKGLGILKFLMMLLGRGGKFYKLGT